MLAMVTHSAAVKAFKLRQKVGQIQTQRRHQQLDHLFDVKQTALSRTLTHLN